jgi:membrane protein
MKFGDILDLAKQTFKEWGEDKASRLGASLAYYTIFSIGPLLLITIAIASFVFSNAKDQIVGTISGVVGSAGGEVITQTIDNANKGGANIIATTIGIITLLLGASGVFGQLKDALNTIWEVEPKPGQGILATIKQRFFSFTMVLGTGFLLLVSLVINAAVAAVSTYLNGILPGGQIIGQILSLVLTFLVITVMFALLFKFLPDVKIAWSDVWVGAAITAILFGLGQLALALYLSLSNVGSAFGATGALVVVLVWIYYSAQILLLGAEFTQVYTNKYGSRVRPAENAEFVTEEARAQQGIKSGEDRSRQTKKPRQLKASPWFN